MAKFIYNNAKNTSMGYILFKLNYGYHPKMLFEDETNSCSKSYSANKLVIKLRNLIKIYC